MQFHLICLVTELVSFNFVKSNHFLTTTEQALQHVAPLRFLSNAIVAYALNFLTSDCYTILSNQINVFVRNPSISIDSPHELLKFKPA